jgi:hypothetical protein
MYRTFFVAALFGGLALPARADTDADAHAEMAAALVAQADLQPAPLSLPSTAAAPRHAAASSAVKRGIGPRAASEVAGAAANQVSQRAQAQAATQALAHQAQAAAAAAAGQAQSQAAKERATHPRPR